MPESNCLYPAGYYEFCVCVDAAGEKMLFVVPAGTAKQKYVIMMDGDLFDVESVIHVQMCEDDVKKIFAAASELFMADAIYETKWERGAQHGR